MKQKLKSLRVHMLIPVVAMTLVVVILLTMLFSRAYISMVLQREKEGIEISFDAVSSSITPVINASINAVWSILANERVSSYVKLTYGSEAELIHGRIDCEDFLSSEIEAHMGIYGLLFMRKDKSLFGRLPMAAYFWDRPEENFLPEDLKTQVLNTPLGEIAYIGPYSGLSFYGYENKRTPKHIMIATWKSVDVRYGECYVMLLMDESFFESLLSPVQDGESTWHLFTEQQKEFYHTGERVYHDPSLLLEKSNGDAIIKNENNESVSVFSRKMTSPEWTLVREVSMEDYEQVVRNVRRLVFLIALIVFVVALVLYELWLRVFLEQFNTLLKGIIRMGEGDLEPVRERTYTVTEFEIMQQQINQTSIALKDQMETIRRMEHEQLELERKRKEQEMLAKELSMAREIQGGVLPHVFPPFPERKEIDLYASMDPARDVGGDFYDYFFVDEDHLCLLIADVSGKGIPAALFMMVAKRILEDSTRLEHSAAEILKRTNGALYDENQADMFVTVWLGILEISTGRLRAANAGHEYPALCTKGRSFTLYRDKHGFVIGGMPDISFKEYELLMEPGDKVFVYTDGVPEATDGNGKMFGTERMLEALNTCRDGSPEEILKGVRKEVDAFVGDAEQFDDLTMLCLEYKGGADRHEEV